MTTKQVSVRLAAVGGKQVKAELVEIGAAGQRSFDQLDRSARIGGGGLQNLGFQVQDFAVQVAGGTDATRALAQQLPQLLSGFGLAGVIAGTAAALGGALIPALMGAEQETASLTERLGTLTEAVKRLDEANAAFSLDGIDKLIAKYGELDASVVLMLSRQQRLAEMQAMAAARELVTGFDEDFAKLFAMLDEYDSRLEQITQRTGATEQEAQSFGAIQESIAFLNEEFGVTLAQAQAIREAVADMASAQTLPEMASAAATLSGLLEQSSMAGSELADNMLATEAALRATNAAGAGMGGWLDAAITGAADLAGELWDAAQAAFSVARGQAAAAAPGASEPGVSANRLAQAYAQYGATRTAADDPMWSVPVPGRRGGGGRRSGGGGGGQSDELREAAQIFDETRTAAEKYAAEVERLNTLHAGGFLSDDTFARAMERLRDKTGEAADAMKGFGSEARSAFVALVTDFGNAEQAAARFFSSIAERLAGQAFDGLFSGGAFGGLFRGIFGGGRAGGGPVRAGWSYMVGEAGPELVTMGGNGHVTSTAALRSAMQGGAGGVVVNVDARGAVEGTAAQIAAALQQAAPQIVQASVAATRAASARGR